MYFRMLLDSVYHLVYSQITAVLACIVVSAVVSGLVHRVSATVWYVVTTSAAHDLQLMVVSSM